MTLELIRRWRAATPDAVAVTGSDGELTYDALLRRVDALAARLRGLGVGPEVPVGISMERTTGMLVALLAVWAAGGAYVPLDPAFPAERLRLMREDAGIDLVLTGADPPAVPCVETGPAGDLAYIMYTSGSTGRPKGVEVPQRAVTNLLRSFGALLGLRPGDAWLAVTTLSFDISVLELLLPLTCGARVVIASTAEASDGPALRARAVAEGVAFMQATPATWRILLESGGVPKEITTRLSGGEALPRDLADALLADGALLWNVYGPTETTVWSTAGPVGAEPIHLGKPIAATTLYLLGPDGRPVAPGEEGELHIGGAGVARGYHGLPAMTASRFLPDPFSGVSGARMYATGDLTRHTADGTLEYLGRADQQVKIRGFRIELGEVETALRASDGVRQAAATVCPGPDGQPQLVAYVVGHTVGAPPPDRAALRARLPEYMIPSYVGALDALPLTPNGKLDRNALPRPQWTSSTPYRAPQTVVERELAAIWADVLGTSAPIGVDDDFFELGGHSLAATQIIARVQSRYAVTVPIMVLFEFPTIAGLAREMDRIDPDDLDLADIAALRDQLDGLSAEDLDELFDRLGDT
ncbi:non-ribosomal peptide synthetase [Streptosporangiaceae bacterium NEAU-GS5]|nr:non-ribosomal peptide synthetase [Streptosporangiaceae bacterium NEAU-GS5]